VRVKQGWNVKEVREPERLEGVIDRPKEIYKIKSCINFANSLIRLGPKGNPESKTGRDHELARDLPISPHGPTIRLKLV
jgi:hypothetical protein